MRSGPLLVVIAALVGGVLMWAGVDAPRPGEKTQVIEEGTPPEPEARVLDEESFPFLEEDDGRLVARVQVQIVELETPDGPRVQLRMRPTALAPDIEPPVGFRGVRGGNLQTALELGQLVEAGALAVVTRADDRAPAPDGEVRVARTASVPERRRLPDGRIDYDARSEPLPVTLSLTSPALGPGTWTTQVLALGTARLEVRFAWDGSEGRLLELSQPAIHDLPSEETEP